MAGSGVLCRALVTEKIIEASRRPTASRTRHLRLRERSVCDRSCRRIASDGCETVRRDRAPSDVLHLRAVRSRIITTLRSRSATLSRCTPRILAGTGPRGLRVPVEPGRIYATARTSRPSHTATRIGRGGAALLATPRRSRRSARRLPIDWERWSRCSSRRRVGGDTPGLNEARRATSSRPVASSRRRLRGLSSRGNRDGPFRRAPSSTPPSIPRRATPQRTAIGYRLRLHA